MLSTYAQASGTETVNVPAGKDITIKRHSSNTANRLFEITGGTFTINATNSSSKLTVDGDNINCSSLTGGAAFRVYGSGASLVINGYNSTDKNVVIKNHKGSTGTVYSGNSASLTMNNVEISSNTSGTNGGGVFLSGGTNTLTSCTITGNTASGYGGGVYQNSGGTNYLLGNMQITGNTAGSAGNNLYISSGRTVALTTGSETLSTSSSIGVTTGSTSYPVDFATGATSAMASCFSSEVSGRSVSYSGGYLRLS